MTDHKFEPFQRVLVRTFHGKWKCEFFSHYDYKEDKPFECAGGKYRECIPYTDETAHFLGTTQPYEPPKPPQEYEWGQKVEAKFNSAWEVAIYIGRAAKNKDIIAVLKDDGIFRQFRENEIRPCPTPPPSDCLTANAWIARMHAQRCAMKEQVYLTVI